MKKLNKDRNLEYKLIAGTKIYHNNGIGDIRVCNYSGEGNMVLYNKKLITPNKFCTSHIEETREGKISNRNAWVACYIIGPDSRKVKLKDIKTSNEPLNKKSKQLDQLPPDTKSENVTTNNNMNMDLNKSGVNIQITEALNKYIEQTRQKQNRARKRMPSKKKVNKGTQKYTEGDEVICGRTIDEWAKDLYKTKKIRWDRCVKEKIVDPDDYSQTTFAVRRSKSNPDHYEMCNETMTCYGDIIPWKDTKDEIPDKYKDSNGYVRPYGEIVYEYRPHKDSPYHELSKTAYRKYRYVRQLYRFVETGHIVHVEDPKPKTKLGQPKTKPKLGQPKTEPKLKSNQNPKEIIAKCTAAQANTIYDGLRPIMENDSDIGTLGLRISDVEEGISVPLSCFHKAKDILQLYRKKYENDCEASENIVKALLAIKDVMRASK